MQLTIRTAKAPIQANVIIPGSKNIAYRAIILSALADGVCEISGLQVSENIKLLIAALRELGIVTQLDEASRYCIIAGGNGKLPKKQATLWCHDSLTLSYLLMAICSATSGVYYFDGSASLRERPLTFMMNTLSRQGIQFIPGDSQKNAFYTRRCRHAGRRRSHFGSHCQPTYRQRTAHDRTLCTFAFYFHPA